MLLHCLAGDPWSSSYKGQTLLLEFVCTEIVCFAKLELSLMSTYSLNARTQWRYGLTSVLRIYRPPSSLLVCSALLNQAPMLSSPGLSTILKLLSQVITYVLWRERNFRIFRDFNSASLHLPHRQDNSRPPALHSTATSTSASPFPDAALLLFLTLSCLMFSFL